MPCINLYKLYLWLLCGIFHRFCNHFSERLSHWLMWIPPKTHWVFATLVLFNGSNLVYWCLNGISLFRVFQEFQNDYIDSSPLILFQKYISMQLWFTKLFFDFLPTISPTWRYYTGYKIFTSWTSMFTEVAFQEMLLPSSEPKLWSFFHHLAQVMGEVSLKTWKVECISFP